MESVCWAGEKLFRAGARGGGKQNLAARAKNALKKAQVSNDLLREGGKHQGAASAVVSLGISFRGKGTLRLAPAKTKINTEQHIETVENAHLPDCRELFGAPPSRVPQQGGATSHAPKATQAKLKEKFPKFRGEAARPPTSPDLNPLDYFARGATKAAPNKKKPKRLGTPKVAAKQSAAELPMDMAQRAALGFRKRVKLCVLAEGGNFERRKLAPGGAPLEGAPAATAGYSGGEEDGGEGEEERNRERK